MIKAVLFDCDGLMFDTERIAIQLWKDMCEQYGIELPEDFFIHITGVSAKDCNEYVSSLPGLSEIRSEIHRRRFDLDYWSSFGNDEIAMKGLNELFVYLKTKGIKTAICSSSPRIYVETLLGTLTRPLEYDDIVCGDMVKHAKPDPEIFLTGAENLNVLPNECMVLEDSKQGIIAAYRAGMHSCFIQDMIEPDVEMKQYIEYQKDSLKDVIELIEEMNQSVHF